MVSEESKRYTVDYHEGQWAVVEADAGMCCRPSTKNYWLAHGAAMRANGQQLQVKDWRRVLEMLRETPDYEILCSGLLPEWPDPGPPPLGGVADQNS
jgi:hypothetical protein